MIVSCAAVELQRTTKITYNEPGYEAAPMETSNDAQLSSQPRDLITLWREFQFGLNGRKAGRQFRHKREMQAGKSNKSSIIVVKSGSA
jgi:hypothetical protein